MGREAVDEHLSALLTDEAASFSSGKKPFDPARYDRVLAYYETLDIPAAAPALFYLRTVGKAHEGDWEGVLADVIKVKGDRSLVGEMNGARFENTFIPMLGKSGDASIVGRAVALLDADMETASLYSKPYVLDMKSGLLRSVGSDVAADEAKAQADVFRKQVQEEIEKNNALLNIR